MLTTEFATAEPALANYRLNLLLAFVLRIAFLVVAFGHLSHTAS